MWLRGKELSDIKQNENQYLLISCLDDPHTVGRYVSLKSDDGNSPLTLCQGKKNIYNYQNAFLNREILSLIHI